MGRVQWKKYTFELEFADDNKVLEFLKSHELWKFYFSYSTTFECGLNFSSADSLSILL